MKGRKLLCEDFMRTKPAKFTDSLESQWELKHLLTALQCDITSQCFSLEEANTYHESKCHMPSLSLSFSPFPTSRTCLLMLLRVIASKRKRIVVTGAREVTKGERAKSLLS